MSKDKQFIAYYYINGFDNLSLGFHISLSMPNIEIHVPFGFIRIGWENKMQHSTSADRLDNKFLYRAFGLTGSN